MIRSEADRLVRAVVCPPGREYFSVRDPEDHNFGAVPDRRKGINQHTRLREILAASGCEVVEVRELPHHPNSVFTRDPSVCTPEGFVRLRMGLPTRRGEEQWIAETLRSLGEPCVGNVEPPGTAEGGDIILAGNVAFVGLSSRTNREGVRQINEILTSLGYDVRVARVPPTYLHLGGAMSLVGPDRVLICQHAFETGLFTGYNRLEVPGGSFVGGNVIVLGENEVVADLAQHATVDVLDRAGFTVHALNLSEFVKGKGGPSCLILPQARSGS
ncbi:MAG: dimethylarginine dimethylaminohydrolase family protein [Fidelibacterota bacterium]